MSASLHEELLVRSARLDAVPPGWRLATVGEVCSIRNDLRKPISREERKGMRGIYPYYGPTGVLDHIDEYRLDGTYALIGEDGDHFLEYTTKQQTQLVKGKANVNNHAHVIESTAQCAAEWFFNFFRHRNITDFLSRQGAGRYKLNKETLERLPILVPPMSVQETVNCTISIWDTAIEKTEQLIAAKERHYTHELSRFISRVQHSQHHISEFAREVSERNRDGACERVLSVTNDRGFVLPEHQFERRVASEDLSNYKVVRKGQYAYNPSRINVGSIARLDDYDMGVLSPMYAVFAIDSTKINSDFFKHWLDSHEARERIKRSAQGSVRETVSFTEFATIRFPLPLLDQQQKIANYLNTLREEIALLAAYAGKLKEQKRGLMQKLLTGQWRLNTAEEMSA